MMYTVDNTTATSATLSNLQCNTVYTIWVHARGVLNGKTSVTRMGCTKFLVVILHIEVTSHFTSASSFRLAWEWASSGPLPTVSTPPV